MKTTIAAWLRRVAGRLDPNNQPRQTPYSYTIERSSPKHPQGIAIHLDGRGCPLYILSDADWKQAYTQADTDWRQPTEKIRDMFEQFGTDLADYWTNPKSLGSKPLSPRGKRQEEKP